MSSASSRFSSRSIATRVMYGTAVVALLAFGVAAAASYLRSSQSLLAGARTTMEGLANLEAQRIAVEVGEHRLNARFHVQAGWHETGLRFGGGFFVGHRRRGIVYQQRFGIGRGDADLG